MIVAIVALAPIRGDDNALEQTNGTMVIRQCVNILGFPGMLALYDRFKRDAAGSHRFR